MHSSPISPPPPFQPADGKKSVRTSAYSCVSVDSMPSSRRPVSVVQAPAPRSGTYGRFVYATVPNDEDVELWRALVVQAAPLLEYKFQQIVGRHDVTNARDKISLVEELGDVFVLGLTATPPADMDAREWELYRDVFDDADFEVPTPAVVREGDLAPSAEQALRVGHP